MISGEVVVEERDHARSYSRGYWRSAAVWVAFGRYQSSDRSPPARS